MNMARMVSSQSRRLIVYNHTQNDSYQDVAKKIDVEAFLEGRWPKTAEFQVMDYLRKNFNEFLEVSMGIKYNAIILDDTGASFHQNCTPLEVDFMGTPKNNHNDIFYQMHHFNQAPPKLLLAMDMIVLKETDDELPLEKKVPHRKIIGKLLQEIRAENDLMPENQRWNERIIDMRNGIVYHTSLDGKVIGTKRFRDFH